MLHTYKRTIYISKCGPLDFKIFCIIIFLPKYCEKLFCISYNNKTKKKEKKKERGQQGGRGGEERIEKKRKHVVSELII
jgi:hypothetical protein